MKVAAAASFSGWGVSARVAASHGQGSESSTENLLSRGLVYLGKPDSKGNETNRYYEVEDENGAKVSNISYNTKYRLKNIRGYSYVDFHLDQGWRWVFSQSIRSRAEFLIFENPNGSADTAKVPDGGAVLIKFLSKMDGTSRGYMHIIVDGKNSFLASSATTMPASGAAKLTLTYTG